MNFYDSLFVFCFSFGAFVLDNRKDTWGEREIVCDFLCLFLRIAIKCLPLRQNINGYTYKDKLR